MPSTAGQHQQSNMSSKADYVSSLIDKLENTTRSMVSAQQTFKALTDNLEKAKRDLKAYEGSEKQRIDLEKYNAECKALDNLICNPYRSMDPPPTECMRREIKYMETKVEEARNFMEVETRVHETFVSVFTALMKQGN